MADAEISLLGEFARWSLRMPSSCTHDFIKMKINRYMRAGERLVARLGPDEWLLCAPAGEPVGIETVLTGEHHSLVDVGHRYAAFSVQGAAAHVLLAAGCPLDLDPSAFAAGTATRTLLGKAEIILWRLHEATAYRVECARSLGPYVRDFLQEAAREWRVDR